MDSFGGKPEAQSMARPLIGIQYYTGFHTPYNAPDLNDTYWGSPKATCWRDHPFQLPDVRSAVFSPDPVGFCYSFMERGAGAIHAKCLAELGIDFVVHDQSGLTKTHLPILIDYPGGYPRDQSIHNFNLDFYCARMAIEGFRWHQEKHIKSVFMLALTSWVSQGFGVPDSEPDHNREYSLISADQYFSKTKLHIEQIWQLYVANPADYLEVEGKPILLFYISEGNNVYQFRTNDRAFLGPGQIIPTHDQFNPEIDTPVGRRKLRDLFTIRYAVVGSTDFDYTPFSHEIWPFEVAKGRGGFSEVAYASAHARGTSEPPRNIGRLEQMVEASRGSRFLLLRSWNEFSSTDEIVTGGVAFAFTLEPNTQLHKYDDSNGDPWFYYNRLKAKLASL
jgi:hypothetical protein